MLIDYLDAGRVLFRAPQRLTCLGQGAQGAVVKHEDNLPRTRRQHSIGAIGSGVTLGKYGGVHARSSERSGALMMTALIWRMILSDGYVESAAKMRARAITSGRISGNCCKLVRKAVALSIWIWSAGPRKTRWPTTEEVASLQGGVGEEEAECIMGSGMRTVSR